MQIFGYELILKRIAPPPSPVTTATVEAPPVPRPIATKPTAEVAPHRGRPKGKCDSKPRTTVLNRAQNLRPQLMMAIATGSTGREDLTREFAGLYERRQVMTAIANARVDGLVAFDGSEDTFALTDRGRAWLKAHN